MDIQVSSNFERLLFEMHDRDAEYTAGLMRQLVEHRAFRIGDDAAATVQSLFHAGRCTESETLETIAAVHRDTAMVIDPHTAVGVAVGERLRGPREIPMVTLATAHPAKFPDAVERAIGIPPCPARPPRRSPRAGRALHDAAERSAVGDGAHPRARHGRGRQPMTFLADAHDRANSVPYPVGRGKFEWSKIEPGQPIAGAIGFHVEKRIEILKFR